MKNRIEWLTEDVIANLKEAMHKHIFQIATNEKLKEITEECTFISLSAQNNCREEGDSLFKIYKDYAQVNQLLRTKYKNFNYDIKIKLDKNDLSLHLYITPLSSEVEQRFVLFQ